MLFIFLVSNGDDKKLKGLENNLEKIRREEREKEKKPKGGGKKEARDLLKKRGRELTKILK